MSLEVSHTVPEKSGSNWTDPGWSGCNWKPLDTQIPLDDPHLLSFWVVCLQSFLGPSTRGIYNVHNVMIGSHIYLGLFCQVRWSSDTQNPGEGCTIITKNHSQIEALDIVYT